MRSTTSQGGGVVEPSPPNSRTEPCTRSHIRHMPFLPRSSIAWCNHSPFCRAKALHHRSRLPRRSLGLCMPSSSCTSVISCHVCRRPWEHVMSASRRYRRVATTSASSSSAASCASLPGYTGLRLSATMSPVISAHSTFAHAGTLVYSPSSIRYPTGTP